MSRSQQPSRSAWPRPRTLCPSVCVSLTVLWCRTHLASRLSLPRTASHNLLQTPATSLATEKVHVSSAQRSGFRICFFKPRKFLSLFKARFQVGTMTIPTSHAWGAHTAKSFRRCLVLTRHPADVSCYRLYRNYNVASSSTPQSGNSINTHDKSALSFQQPSYPLSLPKLSAYPSASQKQKRKCTFRMN